jgi:small-conductance mechanosensitive channel
MRSSLRYSQIGVVLLWVILLIPPAPTHAQLPGLPDVTQDVRRALGQEATNGQPARAPVRFNDRVLFQITGLDLEQAKARAAQVEHRIARAWREVVEQRQVPSVDVRLTDQGVVILLDRAPLLTVTDADAARAGVPATEQAGDWAVRIERALAQALEERRPEFVREGLTRAGLILLVGLLAHLAIWLFARRFFDRPGWPVLMLVWISVVHHVLDVFPQTRPLNNLLSAGLLRPVAIIIFWSLIAAALSRLLGIMLQRAFPVVPETLSPEERTERTLRRRATLGAVLRVTAVSVIWVVAVVIMIARMGVNLPALLASAGLIGVALGLAAQDSMKDHVSGINILLDDRFGVGDVIQVGAFTGKVETLNLRVTQIRDITGRLITIPNRQIDTVANLTSRWSQVDFKVGVSYETDLREAMRVMEQTVRDLMADWPGRVLSPPEMLGPDSTNDSDITLRMLVRTAPGDQWAVERELRLRIKEAFDAAGIMIPYPQRTLRMASGGSPVTPPPPGAASPPPTPAAGPR